MVCVMTKRNDLEENKTPVWNSKIFVINKSIGLAGCGLKTDLKIIVKRARKIAKNFSFVFGKQIPPNLLTNELSNFFQEFTYSSGVRPFGLCIFIVGFGNEGPDLFQINPDGNIFYIKANIIGKKANCGLHFLNKRWNKKLNQEEAVSIGFFTLKEATEGKLNGSDINLAIVNDIGVFKIWRKKEVIHLLSKSIV